MWRVYTHTRARTRTYWNTTQPQKRTKFCHLEGIMLSEISQTEKDKYCMVSLICGILKKQNKLVNITKKRSRLTNVYQWGDTSGEGQERGEELRGTHYYT